MTSRSLSHGVYRKTRDVLKNGLPTISVSDAGSLASVWLIDIDDFGPIVCSDSGLFGDIFA